MIYDWAKKSVFNKQKLEVDRTFQTDFLFKYFSLILFGCDVKKEFILFFCALGNFNDKTIKNRGIFCHSKRRTIYHQKLNFFQSEHFFHRIRRCGIYIYTVEWIKVYPGIPSRNRFSFPRIHKKRNSFAYAMWFLRLDKVQGFFLLF